MATLEVFEFGNCEVVETDQFDFKESLFLPESIGIFETIMYSGARTNQPMIVVVGRVFDNLDNPRDFDIQDKDPIHAAKNLSEVIKKIIDEM